MAAYDISRNTFDPKKHYASVRMQQGRVMMDDDWNENERIENEERRRTRVEVIGPFGSPDDGFKIVNLQEVDGLVDFLISSGTLHLGGLRLELDEEDTTYRTQEDWLGQDDGLYPVPDLAELDEPRYDLIYVEAWQQPVSAIEDNELFEAALAGPDTSTRMRTMRRIKVFQDTGSGECFDAWSALVKDWADTNLGQINHSHELIPDAQLQVEFSEDGITDDLCAPNLAGGYLGAENTAIRVQLIDDQHFTWGFDNAAPLYRVQQIDSTTFKLLTPPHDQHHWPLSGQTVEILPWSAILPNGEKVAEIAGHLSKLTVSYDPESEEITLADPVSAGFGDTWLTGDADTHLYMRVWNRGSDTLSPANIPFTAGSSVNLQNTGVNITITGSNLNPGQHWVVALRPETPHEAMPWKVQVTGMPPQGFRKYYAPLAIIRWEANNQNVEGAITRDCRKTFRPLTDLETCCTFDVGDGRHSFGDFNDLEEAVANLPEEGGRICVLAGTHQANLKLLNRRNIVISGCGDRSYLIPRKETSSDPIIAISGSENITVEHLNFGSSKGTAIRLDDNLLKGDNSARISIRHNRILAGEYGIFIRANENKGGENDIYIGHNEIALPDREGAMRGIFCLADRVLIEWNRITVVPAPNPDDPGNDPWGNDEPGGGIYDDCPPEKGGFYAVDFKLEKLFIRFFTVIALLADFIPRVNFKALGGIQIGGGSENVRIRENTILNGAGNGVTLGHTFAPPVVEDQSPLTNLGSITDTGELSADFSANEVSEKAYQRVQYEAQFTGEVYSTEYQADFIRDYVLGFRGVLYEIVIERNTIRQMGLAGVGVAAFFNPVYEKEGLVILVESLTLYHNLIQRCALQLPRDDKERNYGFGGIVLDACDGGMIEENRVEDCGLSIADPICGIFIRTGRELVISNNRILNNGPRSAARNKGFAAFQNQLRQGLRAGIMVAFSYQFGYDADSNDPEAFLSFGIPAAQIHNNIVVQPMGQALFLNVLGRVSVIGNSFTTQEFDPTNPVSIRGACIIIRNVGISRELQKLSMAPTYQQLAHIKPSYERQAKDDGKLKAILEAMDRRLQIPTGITLFSNNQVTLDIRGQNSSRLTASILIQSKDDVEFSGNQCQIRWSAPLPTPDKKPLYSPMVINHVMLAGTTIRTLGNRLEEALPTLSYSLYSKGFLNTTTNNQSSHCLFAQGTRKVFVNNLEGFTDVLSCRETVQQVIHEMEYNEQVSYIPVKAYRYDY